jgi:hypothetical protein
MSVLRDKAHPLIKIIEVISYVSEIVLKQD